MLETVALCTVMFDLSGVWISFLPSQMQFEVHQEIGLEPWSDEVLFGMTDALDAAAAGDGMAAWQALHAAEQIYQDMSADEIVAQVLRCAEQYPFEAGAPAGSK